MWGGSVFDLVIIFQKFGGTPAYRFQIFDTVQDFLAFLRPVYNGPFSACLAMFARVLSGASDDSSGSSGGRESSPRTTFGLGVSDYTSLGVSMLVPATQAVASRASCVCSAGNNASIDDVPSCTEIEQ